MKHYALLCLLLLAVGMACQDQDERPLREKLSDTAPGERWIYDDWNKAKADASSSGKPIMAVFRCVP